MGKVHVGAAGWLANNTSSWDNPSVNNPAVVEEIPRVIDDWPEESTGKIYRVYSNSSEPVFTGEYQGNRNLMSGATAVYNPDHKAWYAGGYVIYQNDKIDAIIRRQQREHEYQIAIDKFNSPNDFEEAAHLSSDGNFDMYEIMKALFDIGFDGPIRPDHGRMIWDEVAMPGYGLYDRALGAAYLNGLWEAIEKSSRRGI